MDRYVSEPLPIPEYDASDVSRADLVLTGVDHEGDSYIGHVYLDNPDASYETARELEHGYAGSFTVFGHAGCFGDEGHCDPKQRYTDEFDLRPPHPLTPITKTVVVTDALKRCANEVVVTIVAADENDEEGRPSDALDFQELRLLTYAD